MSSRARAGVVLGLAIAACGTRTGLVLSTDGTAGTDGASGTAASSGGGSAGHGGSVAGVDGGGVDASDDGGLYGPAPVPACKATNSECVQNDAGIWSGAAVIDCDGVYFVGPWTLLLDRMVNTQFETVQIDNVMEPGFGAHFVDFSGPPVQATYRVCSVDPQLGTRCGDPFDTSETPNCACEPLTCNDIQACETSTRDGCGQQITCGACTNGAACNPTTHACCPDGFQPDGTGGCVCAQLHPCYGYTFWDPALCACTKLG